jgi:hypothetical protein
MANYNKLVNLTGKTIDRLKVIKFSHNDENDNRMWECLCSCGNIRFYTTGSLNGGSVKSCGCKSYEYKHGKIPRKHGMTNTRFYKIWKGAKYRCINPKNCLYKYYGGRGIKICDRWLKFDNFLNDMYQSYEEHIRICDENNTTIDRIDTNGDYCLENCKWSTWKEQGNNRKTNAFIKFNNINMTVTQWSDKLHINKSTILGRLHKYGWSVEKTLTTPAGKHNNIHI